MKSILGMSGRPMVELGGTHAHKQFVKGDFVASLQWLDLGPQGAGDGPEPVLCLFPKLRRAETGAFVVPQAKAFEYCDSKGNPTPYLLGAAFKACLIMGFEPMKDTVHRVMDVICECLPDLVGMPSIVPDVVAARQAAPVRGIEISAKVNGKVIKEAVI